MTALPKMKGPASVAALPGPGPDHPLKGKIMNAHTTTTAPAAPATEQPWAKVHRLSSELCAAMRENPDSHAVTIIYANPALTHPIMYGEDREYAELTRLLFVYRNAVHAERDAKGDLETLGREREAAHEALYRAILEAR